MNMVKIVGVGLLGFLLGVGASATNYGVNFIAGLRGDPQPSSTKEDVAPFDASTATLPPAPSGPWDNYTATAADSAPRQSATGGFEGTFKETGPSQDAKAIAAAIDRGTAQQVRAGRDTAFERSLEQAP